MSGEKRTVFSVRGTPAPQGSKKHVGRGIMVESSKKVKPWREAVVWAFIEGGYEMIQGPVSVDIIFTLVKPKSDPKKHIHPDRKPDIDKLVRSTLDALTQAGAIEDDARIVNLYAHKGYAGTTLLPGAIITITGLDN